MTARTDTHGGHGGAPDPRSARAGSPRVTACTFDCYGTLIDWRAGIERALGAALRARGDPGPTPVYDLYTEVERDVETRYAPYREILATSAHRVGERLGIPLSASDAREFAESLPTWSAFPDTVPTLRELGRRGVRRVILSNVDRDLLEETIRRNRLEIDGFVTAEDVRSYKPGAAHWLRFFQDYPGDRETTLHVAHSLVHDIVPAQRLGLRTVWVDRYTEARPPSIRPTYSVRDVRSLFTLDILGGSVRPDPLHEA